MKFFMAMAVAWIILGFDGACAAEMHIWTVEESPASFVDSQGELRGYAVDIVRAIQRRIGTTETILVAPEARVYELALQEANMIIFGFSRTAEREESFHWISLLMLRVWREAARQLKAEGAFQRIAERWLEYLRRQGCRECTIRDGILTF